MVAGVGDERHCTRWRWAAGTVWKQEGFFEGSTRIEGDLHLAYESSKVRFLPSKAPLRFLQLPKKIKKIVFKYQI